LQEHDERAASLEAFIFKLNSELVEALFDRFADLMPLKEFPAISSTLRWDNVQLPPSVNEADIDLVILSVAKPRLQKMAAIVGNALQRCKQLGLPIDGEAFVARIQMLADSDRLEAAGDLRKWRHSEVRLKG